MKRSTIILLMLFLLLGGGAIWVMQQGVEEQSSTMLGWDRQFKVEDVKEINKIFLAQRSGKTATLTRNRDHWLVDGKYRALDNGMDNLMRAFKEMQVKYKPADAAIPNVVKDLATQGIKVELYNKEDELIKAFYIGGAPTDERGTYMIMENAEQPYVVHLPTWEGNLRRRFELVGEQWRDKTVFRTKVENIESVSVEYPRQQNHSFILERSNKDQFKVLPYYDFSSKRNEKVSQGIVESYLVGFDKVGAEAFETTNPRRDSVLKTIPFCTITLKKVSGDSTQVQLFPILEEAQTFDPKSNTEISYPYVERYFASINQSDFMLVQHRVFEELFWGYSFFFN